MSIVVLLLLLSNSLISQNNACNALLYDFGGGQGNVVPCGPSANTTPQVSINGNGPNVDPESVNCSGAMPGDGGSPTDVLWVTFIIQEGGSFEWQTVPGKDDFYWVLFVSGTQNPSNISTTGACTNLIQLDCGTEFTGWKVESTPDPNFRWRYYIAFYLRGGDMGGNGVIKIRKSCGLSCASSTSIATTSPDVCINSGESVALSVSTDDPPASSYLWTESPDNGTLSSNSIASPTANNVTVTTTYYATVVGANNCPATDSVVVTVGGCCLADAGTIGSSPATGPFSSCVGRDLTNGNGGAEIVFTVSGNAGAGFDYAFILADSGGNILDSNTSGNFDFSGLSAGTYIIYGLSYAQTNTPNTVSTYLAGISNISQIEADDAGTTFCLDLENGAPQNVITIIDVDCGNFPWDGN
jgi:hypothetical protein